MFTTCTLVGFAIIFGSTKSWKFELMPLMVRCFDKSIRFIIDVWWKNILVS